MYHSSLQHCYNICQHFDTKKIYAKVDFVSIFWKICPLKVSEQSIKNFANWFFIYVYTVLFLKKIFLPRKKNVYI